MRCDGVALHSGLMSASSATVSPLLVGRDDVLELCERRLDEVAAGRGQMLLLTGEAGIGKSRMVAAIRGTARDRGLPVVQADIAPQDRDVPAALIMDFARTAAATSGTEALGADLMAVRDQVTSAEHAARRMLVVDVVGRIRASIVSPIVLVFEDLQWSDELSLEIIADLARATRDLSLLIVATYRSDESPPGTTFRDWRSRLITQRIAEEVRLRPLELAETALVTTLILDTGLPAPREVVDAVHARTDGVPLHIEELLGAMSAQARADGRAIREANVPETIEDAVLERLGRRSDDAQMVARAGAVIGRCFVPDVLAGIMDVRPEDLDEPIQELVDNGVLVPVGPRGMVDFRHQLLRDAIYRSVTLRDRRRYHARAAEFGARLEGQSEIHASAHYERAGLRGRAFETALIGARDAVRLSAHREAFELYRRVVDNMPDGLEPGERAQILEAYATEAANIEENAIAAEWAYEASDAYRAAGLPAQAASVMSIRIGMWRRNGLALSQRIPALRELLAGLEDLPTDDRDVQFAYADVVYALAATLIDARQIPEARSHLTTLRVIAERLDDREWAVAADWKEAAADIASGDVTDGLAKVVEAARTAERAGWEGTGVTAFRDASTIAASVLDYRGAAAWIGEGLRYADSIEQSYCAHLMSSTMAMVSWGAADLADAESRAKQSVADRGCRRAAMMARWVLGFVDLTRGSSETASTLLIDAFEFGVASEEIELTLPPLWGLAEVALQTGQPDLAFERCQDALERARAVDERSMLAPFVVTGVRAALQAGRPADASVWLEACGERLASVPEVGGAALAHGRGLVALSEGSTGVARTALEVAIVGWDGHGRAWESTWARIDLAHALVRSNRFAEALGHATDARAAASRLGSARLAERADGLIRMARGHASDDEPWRPLTAREFEVARLIGDGFTNAEIADALGIAPKTASSHVEHILAKLGVSRRAEVATWASRVQPRHTAQDAAVAGAPTRA